MQSIRFSMLSFYYPTLKEKSEELQSRKWLNRFFPLVVATIICVPEGIQDDPLGSGKKLLSLLCMGKARQPWNTAHSSSFEAAEGCRSWTAYLRRWRLALGFAMLGEGADSSEPGPQVVTLASTHLLQGLAQRHLAFQIGLLLNHLCSTKQSWFGSNSEQSHWGHCAYFISLVKTTEASSPWSESPALWDPWHWPSALVCPVTMLPHSPSEQALCWDQVSPLLEGTVRGHTHTHWSEDPIYTRKPAFQDSGLT